jgi:hypothetical protein
MLEQLHFDLHQMQVVLLLAHVHAPVREMLRRFGLLESIGEAHIYSTLEEGVEAFLLDPDLGLMPMLALDDAQPGRQTTRVLDRGKGEDRT